MTAQPVLILSRTRRTDMHALAVALGLPFASQTIASGEAATRLRRMGLPEADSLIFGVPNLLMVAQDDLSEIQTFLTQEIDPVIIRTPPPTQPEHEPEVPIEPDLAPAPPQTPIPTPAHSRMAATAPVPTAPSPRVLRPGQPQVRADVAQAIRDRLEMKLNVDKLAKASRRRSRA